MKISQLVQATGIVADSRQIYTQTLLQYGTPRYRIPSTVAPVVTVGSNVHRCRTPVKSEQPHIEIILYISPTKQSCHPYPP